jgi:hypothetical protein
MAPSPEQQQFINIALKDLDFLMKDFGFTATPETVCGVGLSFTKDAHALKVSLGWYKGEVDFEFEVLLENSVFRPYVSRRFGLGEIVNFIDPNAITKELRERPPLPRWVLSAEDVHSVLQFRAMLVQKFCLPVLNGNFEVLEAITWARRREWGKTDEERYGKFGQGIIKGPTN